MGAAKPSTKKPVSAPAYERVRVKGSFVRRTLVHQLVLSGYSHQESEVIFDKFLKEGRIKEVGKVGLAMSVMAYEFVKKEEVES